MRLGPAPSHQCLSELAPSGTQLNHCRKYRCVSTPAPLHHCTLFRKHFEYRFQVLRLGPAPSQYSCLCSRATSTKWMTVKCPCGEGAISGKGKVCKNGITNQVPEGSEDEVQQFIHGMAERMANHVHAVRNVHDWREAMAMITDDLFEVLPNPAPTLARPRSRSPRRGASSASSTIVPIGLPAQLRARTHPVHFHCNNGDRIAMDLAQIPRHVLLTLQEEIEHSSGALGCDRVPNAGLP